MADLAVGAYPQLGSGLQSPGDRAFDESAGLEQPLLAAIAARQIDAADISVNQIRRLLVRGDDELIAQTSPASGARLHGAQPRREKTLPKSGS